MADSADMVVIGANFGSGSKGGLMSTFLMGVHDPKTNKWKTVCKVCFEYVERRKLRKL
jgi:DNA ligase-3